MRYTLNVPLKECKNKRRTDKRQKENQQVFTTLTTPTSIHTNQTKHQNKV